MQAVDSPENWYHIRDYTVQNHNQCQYSSKALHTSDENQKLACRLDSKNI
jgi:hypothetical protein